MDLEYIQKRTRGQNTAASFKLRSSWMVFLDPNVLMGPREEGKRRTSSVKCLQVAWNKGKLKLSQQKESHCSGSRMGEE